MLDRIIKTALYGPIYAAIAFVPAVMVAILSIAALGFLWGVATFSNPLEMANLMLSGFGPDATLWFAALIAAVAGIGAAQGER